MPLQVPTYEIYMNREDCEPSILYGVLSLLKSTTHRPFGCMARPLGGGAQMDQTVSGNRLLASPPKRGHSSSRRTWTGFGPSAVSPGVRSGFSRPPRSDQVRLVRDRPKSVSRRTAYSAESRFGAKIESGLCFSLCRSFYLTWTETHAKADHPVQGVAAYLRLGSLTRSFDW
jgi:hypothetical protein